MVLFSEDQIFIGLNPIPIDSGPGETKKVPVLQKTQIVIKNRFCLLLRGHYVIISKRK